MATPRIVLVSLTRDAEREADARALASAIRAHGLKATLALPGGAVEQEGERPVPSVGRRAGARDAAASLALVALLSEEKPALVHALHGRALPAVLGAAEVAKTPMRVATVSRAPDELFPERGAGGRLLSRLRAATEGAAPRALHRVDRVIATTRATEQAWVKSGWVPASRMRGLEVGLGVSPEPWVDEGPSSERRAAARARLGASGLRHVIASDLRGASAEARARYRALERRLRAHTRWYTLGGEGLGVPADAAAWTDAVVASDVVVQLEGGAATPRAVARAALARVACVAWDSVAHRAVIRDGETGTLVRRVEDVEGAVRTWLDDPGRREQAGAVARSWALRRCDRGLAVERVVRWYDELWRSAISAPAILNEDGRFAADEGGRRRRDLMR